MQTHISLWPHGLAKNALEKALDKADMYKAEAEAEAEWPKPFHYI